MELVHPAVRRDESEAWLRKLTLEQEIQNLRGDMEKAAYDENSFTSETVVTISRQLDEKINEYNAFMLELARSGDSE